MKIIVNGVKKEWYDDTITYKEIVLLSNQTYKPDVDYSMTYSYHNFPGIPWSSIMSKGQSVTPKEGMIFNVYFTGNA